MDLKAFLDFKYGKVDAAMTDFGGRIREISEFDGQRHWWSHDIRYEESSCFSVSFWALGLRMLVASAIGSAIQETGFLVILEKSFGSLVDLANPLWRSCVYGSLEDSALEIGIIRISPQTPSR